MSVDLQSLQNTNLNLMTSSCDHSN